MFHQASLCSAQTENFCFVEMSSTKWKSENGFGESSDLFGVDFKREAVSDSEGSAMVHAEFEIL